MDFGMFMEFGCRPGKTQAEAFQEGFKLVDAAEEWGLDGAWLAELHFNPTRSVLSSPITGQLHRRPHPADAHRHGRVCPPAEQSPAHRRRGGYR